MICINRTIHRFINDFYLIFIRYLILIFISCIINTDYISLFICADCQWIVLYVIQYIRLIIVRNRFLRFECDYFFKFIRFFNCVCFYIIVIILDAVTKAVFFEGSYKFCILTQFQISCRSSRCPFQTILSITFCCSCYSDLIFFQRTNSAIFSCCKFPIFIKIDIECLVFRFIRMICINRTIHRFINDFYLIFIRYVISICIFAVIDFDNIFLFIRTNLEAVSFCKRVTFNSLLMIFPIDYITIFRIKCFIRFQFCICIFIYMFNGIFLICLFPLCIQCYRVFYCKPFACRIACTGAISFRIPAGEYIAGSIRKITYTAIVFHSILITRYRMFYG